MKRNRRMDHGWRSINTVIALGVLALLVLPAAATAQDKTGPPPTWSNQATFTGNISTNGVFGSIPTSGSTHGQWRIKQKYGGSWSSWQDHGDTYTFYTGWTYVVEFKDVSGYTTPADHEFNQWDNYNYTGNYSCDLLTFTGNISTDGVFGDIPSSGSDHGQWRIKKKYGGTWSGWMEHGNTYKFEKNTKYQVEFKDVSGYNTPGDHEFEKSSNYSYTGNYTSNCATFTGNISTDGVFGDIPSSGSDHGQWRIKKKYGGTWSGWMEHGNTYKFEKNKDYEVEFKDVSGYITPGDHSFKKSSNYSYTGDYTTKKGTLNIDIVVNGWMGGSLPYSRGWSFSSYSDNTLTGSNWSQSVKMGNYNLDVDPAPDYWTRSVDIVGPTCPPNGGYPFSVGHNKTTTITITYTQQTGYVKLYMDRNAADIYPGLDPQTVAKWHITAGPTGYPTGSYDHAQAVEVPAGTGYAFSWDSVTGWNQTWVAISGKTVDPGTTFEWSEIYLRQKGSAKLYMDPTEVQSSTYWYIVHPDGDLGPFNHGQTVNDLPTGDYTFYWTPLTCWDQQKSSVIGTVTNGGLFEDTEYYTRQTFLLQVNMTYNVPLQVGETPGTASVYDGLTPVFTALSTARRLRSTRASPTPSSTTPFPSTTPRCQSPYMSTVRTTVSRAMYLCLSTAPTSMPPASTRARPAR